MSDPEDLRLIEKYLEGSLSAEEKEQFLKRLDTDTDLDDEAHLQGSIDLALRALLETDNEAISANVVNELKGNSGRLRKAVIDEIQSEASARRKRHKQKRHKRVSFLPQLIALAAALVLIIGGYVFYLQQQKVDYDGTVSIAGIGSIEFYTGPFVLERNGMTVAIDTFPFKLCAGDRLNNNGFGEIEVSLNGGSVVSFVPGTKTGTTAVFKSSREVLLEDGILKGSIGKQTAGTSFSMESAHARITVLGTVFTFRADSEQSELSVQEGLVRFERLSDNKQAEVKAGFSIDTTSMKLTPITGKPVREFSFEVPLDPSIVKGGPKEIPGVYGKALEFDGIDDYIIIPDPETLPGGKNPRSIALWARASKVAPQGTDLWDLSEHSWIISYGTPQRKRAMSLGRTANNLTGSPFETDHIRKEDFWKLDGWHHLALTYDGATAKLYADGVLVSSEKKDWDLIPKLGYIGRQILPLDKDGQYWHGAIDEVKIYNRALTPEEIKFMSTKP